MSFTIIDVSTWNGHINWKEVKASGQVDGVMLRAVSTNDQGIYIDPYFEENYQGCKENDIPVGAYYYTYANDMDTVLRELAYLKSALQGKILDLPIAVDVEEQSLTSIGKDELTRLVKYALTEIESWNAYAMLYTYTYYKQNLDYYDLRMKFDSWVADYRGIKPAEAGMWQYTSKGKIPGIDGAVDMSTTDIDYPKIIYDKSLNCFIDVPAPVETEQPQVAETDKMSKFKTILEFIDKIIHFLKEVIK